MVDNTTMMKKEKINKFMINKACEAFGGRTVKRKEVLQLFAEDIAAGTIKKGAVWRLLNDQFRVGHGLFQYSVQKAEASVQKPQVVQNNQSAEMALANGVAAIGDASVYIPEKDETYVKWGQASVVEKVIRSGQFFPVFISGFSGNGKTFMVEQACANTKRNFIRVQITPETDEDDLIGGFRLIDGNTVFEKGPVIRAMESGAVLLIDEIDRATNKIMSLQGVLEGKPILLKKIGKMIHPAPGFNIIATGNTKGSGSEDGRYSAAGIIDESLLERFVININQAFPSRAIEKKIIFNHAEKYGLENAEKFLEELGLWGEVIRKTFEQGSLDDFISTRRLCHVVQTTAILQDPKKAIELCVNRFEDDTAEAFRDLFEKIASNDESVWNMINNNDQEESVIE